MNEKVCSSLSYVHIISVIYVRIIAMSKYGRLLNASSAPSLDHQCMINGAHDNMLKLNKSYLYKAGQSSCCNQGCNSEVGGWCVLSWCLTS